MNTAPTSPRAMPLCMVDGCPAPAPAPFGRRVKPRDWRAGYVWVCADHRGELDGLAKVWRS